jgi:hypothetical protein
MESRDSGSMSFMGANAAIALSSAVAVETEHSEAIREVLVHKPSVQKLAVLQVQQAPVCRAIARHVVDGQKQRFRLATAYAARAVVGQHLLAQLLVVPFSPSVIALAKRVAARTHGKVRRTATPNTQPLSAPFQIRRALASFLFLVTDSAAYVRWSARKFCAAVDAVCGFTVAVSHRPLNVTDAVQAAQG